jgi:hypothetical protein
VNLAIACLNPNLEMRNSKQVLNTNDRNLKKCLEHLNFGIGICLGFSALSLEFESTGL